MAYQLLLVIHILIASIIVVLVLLQHGKGADVGAAFGSGASDTFFGSQGSSSFLYKATLVLALCFGLTSIGLTHFAAISAKYQLVPTNVPVVNQPVLPPTPTQQPQQQSQPQPQSAVPVTPVAPNQPNDQDEKTITK